MNNARLTPEQVIERNKLVYQLRHDGHTFKEIGMHCNVSVDGARKIYEKAKRKIERPHEFDALPTWLANALFTAGYQCRTDVLKAYDEGRLRPDVGAMSNYGRIGHNTVEKWLGLPTTKKVKCSTTVCPHCGGKLC